MAMEEPDAPELIRDLFQITRGIADDVRDLKTQQDLFVTRELYTAHREQDERRFAAIEARKERWWTVVVLPAIVVVFGALFQEWIK